MWAELVYLTRYFFERCFLKSIFRFEHDTLKSYNYKGICSFYVKFSKQRFFYFCILFSTGGILNGFYRLKARLISFNFMQGFSFLQFIPTALYCLDARNPQGIRNLNQCLRRILRFYWPETISNENLCARDAANSSGRGHPTKEMELAWP